jgi:hypothetical protein
MKDAAAAAADSATTTTASPPSSPSSSPSKQHNHHRHHDYHGWTIDDFESRKQLELQQRYTSLIHELRKRKFEKEWEKKHHSQIIHQHSYNTRRGSSSGGGGGGRQRSGSFSGSPSKSGGGGSNNNRRSSSGYSKLEMNQEEKDELERILAEPVKLPLGVLETRPYDYKKKLPKGGGGGDGNNNNGGSSSGNGKANNTTEMSEEEELFHNYRGRNPLFGITKEADRRKVLLRDDHLLKSCTEEFDSSIRRSPRKRQQQLQDNDDDGPTHLDPTDITVTQHIQHDLESLRIERSDPTNLGCSCRKLHVFLPGQSDKSHHKKKGSNRRLNERKLKEELRKRGLLHKGNADMSREKMEKMLHDAIESQPCCWGIDCPCVRSGIGCQADICSCWHASHDVPHAKKKEDDATTDSRKVGESDVEAIERTCGNANGMYVVDMKAIKEHRQQYIATMMQN